MSYSASLDYLYGLQKHGINPGLETVTELLVRLGQPHRAYRTVHVGGTNGKGSTAAMAAGILQAAGYRVGLYTSPHLVDFRERIRVDGALIPEPRVDALTGKLVEAGGAELTTFFEFTTAMAFQHFADQEVEVAVIEVGMGGRFDATNVVTPLVSVITNVALDHEEFLGTTIRAIAAEKAGIIKAGVPVVVGRILPDAWDVVERVAEERQAPVCRWEREFVASGDTVTGFRYDGGQGSYEGLTCPLAGAHQLENAACAVAAVELAAACGLPSSKSAVRTGLRHTIWEGRLEVVERNPRLVLDGAHNPAAGDALAAYLTSFRRENPASRVVLVLSMMRDKDVREFLRRVIPLADEVVLTQAQLPRAAPVHSLAALLEGRARAAHLAPLPAEALAKARQLASPRDLICVTGSLMLVGDIKALLRGCGLSPIRG